MIQNIPLFAIESMAFGCLSLFGIYFGILYAFQRYQKESFYFSIFCFFVSLRVLVTGNHSLGFFLPGFPDLWMTRIDCISSMAMMIAFLYLANSIFPALVPVRVLGVFHFLFWCYVIFVALTPKDFFLSIRWIMGTIAITLLLYTIIMSIISVIKKKEDSKKFLTAVFILGIFYLISYFNIGNELFPRIESYHLILVFSFLIAYLISCRIQRIFQRTRILSDEIQNSNQLASTMNRNYEKFIPTEFFHYLGKDSVKNIQLGDNSEKDLTIQFTQILDFWSIVRGIPSENIFRFLNSYLTRVSPSILRNNGIIDKFIDNTILSIFPGDPSESVKSAIDLQWEIEVYNIHRKKSGYKPIHCGTGIHSGLARIGIIGEENRREITVISDTVNLASRIQGLTERYGARILISLPTIYKCHGLEEINYRLLDMVRVKGKKDHVSIGEILIPNIDDMTNLKIKTKYKFEEGIIHYVKADFETARDMFQSVLQDNPNDKAAIMYFERSDYFLKTNAGSDFEGIHQWDAK